MFKLPGLPSASANIHELADFAELLAWRDGSTSTRQIVAFLGREGEVIQSEGADDDADDENDNTMDEVFAEIEFRQKACKERYPFELDRAGNVLRHTPADDYVTWLYGYLLLSTRLNMQTDRMHAGIDGTLLLEEVSADGLRQYLGVSRARSMVFGTAAEDRNFESKVTNLCEALGEGYKFRNTHNLPMTAKDDKLDVVAWLPLTDGQGSKLIIFGQCKTGTAWTDKLCALQPDSFIKKWVHTPFSFDPVRAYFVSEAANRSRWSGYAIEGGLFFDRCRIMDCHDHMDPNLFEKLKNWSSSALKAVVSQL